MALALLMTVLLPLGSFVLQATVRHRSEDDLRALALAQAYMETTLHERSYTRAHVWEEARRWRVTREVRTEGALVTITIRVYRGAQAEPRVQLCTVRLRPLSDR